MSCNSLPQILKAVSDSASPFPTSWFSHRYRIRLRHLHPGHQSLASRPQILQTIQLKPTHYRTYKRFCLFALGGVGTYMNVVLNKSSQEPPFRNSFANLSPAFAVPKGLHFPKSRIRIRNQIYGIKQIRLQTLQ